MRGGVGVVEVVTFLNSLAKLSLGEWYEGRACPQREYPEPDPPTLGLHSVTVELTRRCNLRCIHCYTRSEPEVCDEELQALEWERVIADAAALGCRDITYTGGEPLLVKELLEVIARAREKGLHGIVFTNATLPQTDLLDSLARLDVRIDTSIYGPNEEVHDRITRTPGSFKGMVNNVLSITARGMPVRMNMPVMLENQDYIEETEGFVTDRLDAEFKMSLILPVGRGRLNGLVSSTDAFSQAASTKLLQAGANGKLREMPVRNRRGFPRVGHGDFARRLQNCWSGRLYVASNGDVIPCAPARQLVLGNVRQSNLETIVSSDAVRRLWGLTKAHVLTCRDCEYRYACTDCWVRVLAEVGSLYEKPVWCFYDAAEGEWQSDVLTVPLAMTDLVSQATTPACSHSCPDQPGSPGHVREHGANSHG